MHEHKLSHYRGAVCACACVRIHTSGHRQKLKCEQRLAGMGMGKRDVEPERHKRRKEERASLKVRKTGK